jgi:hypothetical protein
MCSYNNDNDYIIKKLVARLQPVRATISVIIRPRIRACHIRDVQWCRSQGGGELRPPDLKKMFAIVNLTGTFMFLYGLSTLSPTLIWPPYQIQHKITPDTLDVNSKHGFSPLPHSDMAASMKMAYMYIVR